MARASTVIGLTMLGAAGVGAATIPFMGSGSSAAAGGAQGIAGGGLRCSANRFATVAECQAAGHPTCRPDGTMFVPTTCSTGSSSTSGTRWYNSHPIYWFGGGRSGTTTSGSTPQTVTSTPRASGSGGTTTTTGGSSTSSRGGFGSTSGSHGSGSS